mmetsp:Transcript_53307/g.91615  ORF Transcript_53307/g.91615 Transcript_53307/m.91615 type:complete len:97 (-) Transcript_53307:493-783(-)
MGRFSKKSFQYFAAVCFFSWLLWESRHKKRTFFVVAAVAAEKYRRRGGRAEDTLPSRGVSDEVFRFLSQCPRSCRRRLSSLAEGIPLPCYFHQAAL